MPRNDDRLRIETLNGTMYCDPGDWVIFGLHNEIYPVRNHVFVELYDVLPDSLGIISTTDV